MPKKTLPELYVDEHIKPAVIETFEECGFKCIRISKTKKYAGREEQDYIQEIYAEGRLFVTSDLNYGRNSLRRQIIYVSNDGFRNIDATGNDQLWYSFEALDVELNTPE